MTNNNIIVLFSCILSTQAMHAADEKNTSPTNLKAMAFLTELLSKEKIVVSKDDLAIAQSEAKQSEHKIMLKAMELLKKYPNLNDYSATLWNRNYTKTDKEKSIPNSNDQNNIVIQLPTFNYLHLRKYIPAIIKAFTNIIHGTDHIND